MHKKNRLKPALNIHIHRVHPDRSDGKKLRAEARTLDFSTFDFRHPFSRKSSGFYSHQVKKLEVLAHTCYL